MQTSSKSPDPFPAWYEALERRHMASLTFQEVRQSVQALSRTYVEKRGAHIGSALATRGKQAAFAMFYAPLHFLTVRSIVRELGPRARIPGRIVDLGCGTGAAGAAWASDQPGSVSLLGIDRRSWAVAEARWSCHTLGLEATFRNVDIGRAELPGHGSGIIAAFTINELAEDLRNRIRDRILEAASRGAAVLVVEPISKRAAPWWEEWSREFGNLGGRAARWRFPADLPPGLALMDKAAHLDHRELTARSLWLGPDRST